MNRRIKNTLQISCVGVDLTTVSNIEFYVRQEKLFFLYIPTVTSANTMVVTIPFKDAMELRAERVELQFAFTDADGNPIPSEIKRIPVGDLLKEAGYV